MTDARAMPEEQTPVGRWLVVGLVAIGVAAGVWLAVGSSREAPSVMDEDSDTPVPAQTAGAEPSPATPREEPRTASPDYHIEAGSRLTVDAAALPADGVVTLGLALEREALGGGQGPLPTVVVSASDGRRLELGAEPVAAPKSAVRLEVDSSWLQPGLYMIQVRTAEKTPLPVRRYVLEVRAGPATR